MADGSIIIDLELDKSKASDDLQKTSREIERQMLETERSLKRQEAEIEKTKNKLSEVQKAYEDINNEIKNIEESTKKSVNMFSKEPEKDYVNHLAGNTEYQALLEKQKEMKAEQENLNKLLDKQEMKQQATANALEQQHIAYDGITTQMREQESSQGGVEKATKSTNNELQKTDRHIKKIKLSMAGFHKSFLGGLKTLMRYSLLLLGVRSIFSLLTGAVRTWLSGTDEKAKQLRADIDFIRFAIADMLAPAIEYVVSLFYKMLGLVNAILKSFTGVDYMAKALAKYTEKTRKNMSGTLASFDQLEVQSKQQNQPSSLEEETAQFEGFAEKMKAFFADFTADMDFTNLLTSLTNLKDALKNLGGVAWGYLKDGYEKFLKPVATLVVNKLLPDFINFLADAINWLAEILEIIRPYWNWFLENVLLPIAEWVINEALPTFFDLLRSALELLKPVIEIFCIVFKDLWEIFFEPIAKFTGDLIIKFMELLTDLFKKLGDWIKDNKSEIATFIELFLGFLAGIWIYNSTKMLIPFLINLVGWFAQIVKTIKTFGILKTIGLYIQIFDMQLKALNITSMMLYGTFGLLVIALLLLFANWDKMSTLGRVIGVIGAVTLALTTLMIAIFGVQSALTLGLAAAGIIAGISAMVYATSTAQKQLEKEVQDSTNKASSQVKLARGGIAYQPTQAIIGEAGREAVLPLENNTEWMDDLADKINSKGFTLEFTGSLAQLGRVLRPVIKSEENRIGVRRIVGGANV